MNTNWYASYYIAYELQNNQNQNGSIVTYDFIIVVIGIISFDNKIKNKFLLQRNNKLFLFYE